MNEMLHSSVGLRMAVLGLSAALITASVFAEGRVFIALLAAAFVGITVGLLISRGKCWSAIRYTLSFLTFAAATIAAWKGHMAEATIVVLGICSALMGFVSLVKFQTSQLGEVPEADAGATSLQKK